MSTVDILKYAISKDTENLSQALDAEMGSRIRDAVDMLRVDVAQSMFGQPTVEEQPSQPDETQNDEGSDSNEDIQTAD